MKDKTNLFQKVCDEVISLDDSIRFAGISDKEGKLLAVSERQNLKPLLSDEERAQYAITAATRQYTRLRWEYHLGRIHYASSRYEHLARATIPIADINSTLYYVLLLSFDPDIQNLHKLIMDTVIPKIRKWKKRLLLENMGTN
ncbi:MAG: hypothetical protein GEU26_03390 [Nitrososphaeraceae archaeon]|nr:hypothetical protein [Nitrososphaeraceae archaeon]